MSVNRLARVSDSGVYQCALFPPRADASHSNARRVESEASFFECHRMDTLELSLAIGALLLLIDLLVTAALWIFYLVTKRMAKNEMFESAVR